MDFIKIAPSPTFLSVLEELCSAPGAPSSITKFFEHKEKVKKESKTSSKKSPENDLEVSETIPSELLLRTTEVKWCHEEMRRRGIDHRIHELINESKVILPKPYQPPKNPELQARLEKLRAQEENRQYQNMTRNLGYQEGNSVGASVTGLGQELRQMHSEVNRQLIAGVQYLLSIVGTFFALFVGMGLYGQPFAYRLLVSIIASVVVAIAEIYFIIREDVRAENMLKKQT